jgi:hypothetical protein
MRASREASKHNTASPLARTDLSHPPPETRRGHRPAGGSERGGRRAPDAPRLDQQAASSATAPRSGGLMPRSVADLSDRLSWRWRLPMGCAGVGGLGILLLEHDGRTIRGASPEGWAFSITSCWTYHRPRPESLSKGFSFAQWVSQPAFIIASAAGRTPGRPSLRHRGGSSILQTSSTPRNTPSSP